MNIVRPLKTLLSKRGFSMIGTDAAGFAEKITDKLKKRSGSEWKRFTLSYLTEESASDAGHRDTQVVSNSLALHVLFKLYAGTGKQVAAAREAVTAVLSQNNQFTTYRPMHNEPLKPQSRAASSATIANDRLSPPNVSAKRSAWTRSESGLSIREDNRRNISVGRTSTLPEKLSALLEKTALENVILKKIYLNQQRATAPKVFYRSAGTFANDRGAALSNSAKARLQFLEQHASNDDAIGAGRTQDSVMRERRILNELDSIHGGSHKDEAIRLRGTAGASSLGVVGRPVDGRFRRGNRPYEEAGLSADTRARIFPSRFGDPTRIADASKFPNESMRPYGIFNVSNSIEGRANTQARSAANGYSRLPALNYLEERTDGSQANNTEAPTQTSGRRSSEGTVLERFSNRFTYLMSKASNPLHPGYRFPNQPAQSRQSSALGQPGQYTQSGIPGQSVQYTQSGNPNQSGQYRQLGIPSQAGQYWQSDALGQPVQNRRTGSPGQMGLYSPSGIYGNALAQPVRMTAYDGGNNSNLANTGAGVSVSNPWTNARYVRMALNYRDMNSSDVQQQVDTNAAHTGGYVNRASSAVISALSNSMVKAFSLPRADRINYWRNASGVVQGRPAETPMYPAEAEGEIRRIDLRDQRTAGVQTRLSQPVRRGGSPYISDMAGSLGFRHSAVVYGYSNPSVNVNINAGNAGYLAGSTSRAFSPMSLRYMTGAASQNFYGDMNSTVVRPQRDIYPGITGLHVNRVSSTLISALSDSMGKAFSLPYTEQIKSLPNWRHTFGVAQRPPVEAGGETWHSGMKYDRAAGKQTRLSLRQGSAPDTSDVSGSGGSSGPGFRQAAAYGVGRHGDQVGNINQDTGVSGYLPGGLNRAFSPMNLRYMTEAAGQQLNGDNGYPAPNVKGAEALTGAGLNPAAALLRGIVKRFSQRTNSSAAGAVRMFEHAAYPAMSLGGGTGHLPERHRRVFSTMSLRYKTGATDQQLNGDNGKAAPQAYDAEGLTGAILNPASALLQGIAKQFSRHTPSSSAGTARMLEHAAYPEMQYKADADGSLPAGNISRSRAQSPGRDRLALAVDKLLSRTVDGVARAGMSILSRRQPLNGSRMLTGTNNIQDEQRKQQRQGTNKLQAGHYADMTTLGKKQEKEEALSVLDMIAAPRSDMRNVFSPAEIVMLSPPAYMNQFGSAPAPVGRQDWKNIGWNDRQGKPHGTAQQDASDFFKAQASLREKLGGPFGRMSAGGAAQIVPRYKPPDMTYKENASDATGKLLSQQLQKPRTLNTPMKTTKEIQMQQGLNGVSESELNKMVDKVYSKLESRIKAEKRRFGL